MTTADQRRSHLREAIRGVSLRLKASLGASSPLGDSLSKGELREEDVVSAFRPHMASRYDLVKGLVIDSAGRESDPQDVIILDTFAMPTILGSATTRAVPVEGVCGTIQVKSVATPSSVRSAVANIATAKRLVPLGDRYGMPLSGAYKPGFWSTASTFFGGALFLSKNGDTEAIASAFAKEVMSLPARERCDAMCIVDEVAVLWGDPSKGSWPRFTARAEQAEAPLVLLAHDDVLLFFYMTLVEHLRSWITPPVNWIHYVFGPPGAPTPLEFSYSYWYDEDDPPPWVDPTPPGHS